jgi:hypothetical protein
MDDDDFYGPHHLEDLTHTLAWSGATLAGALHLFTYVAGADMTVERRARPQRETEAAHVPGGTMMIERADLLALGGWRPVATGSIDLALSHAVRESGGTLHLMHGLGFVLCRHGYNHAWSVDDDNFVATSRQRWPGLHPPPELGPAAAFDGQVAALGRVRPA